MKRAFKDPLLLLGLALLAVLFARSMDWLPFQRATYHGVVVDQYGHPLAGVGVSVVVFAPGLAGQTLQYVRPTTTDQNGQFMVTGSRSLPPEVHFEKEFCSYQSGQLAADPVPEVPARFVLARHHPPEPIILNHLSFPLAGNAEVHLDLLRGRLVESGGDLVLHSVTESHMHPRQFLVTTWRLTMEVAEGGLQLSKGSEFEAPPNSYAASAELWSRVWRPREPMAENYYVFTRGALYSRMHLEWAPGGVAAAAGSGTVTIEWRTNPGGSRNLEYALAQDVTRKYANQ